MLCSLVTHSSEQKHRNRQRDEAEDVQTPKYSQRHIHVMEFLPLSRAPFLFSKKETKYQNKNNGHESSQ